MIKVLVCHRPDGLEDQRPFLLPYPKVCHRPDGLEVQRNQLCEQCPVCHRPDGLEGLSECLKAVH